MSAVGIVDKVTRLFVGKHLENTYVYKAQITA
jgi:hypothetical protein